MDSSLLVIIAAVIALVLIVKLIKGFIRMALVLAVLGLALWYASKFIPWH
ncbi:MAG: hypothetical protein ACOY31_03540 [Bacillota bacterium]